MQSTVEMIPCQLENRTSKFLYVFLLQLCLTYFTSRFISFYVLHILPCFLHNALYYIDTNVLLENRPLVKFIRNHIRDPSDVFSISSLVRISMLSLISTLSLKLYLNSLVYCRNIFGSSSKVFGNLQQSSEIFGNFRKMFGNVRAIFGQILENLRKSSENCQLRRH